MSVATALADLLYSAGACLVGFADLQSLPADVRRHLPRGISIAVAIDPEIIAGIHAGPTREYYTHDLRAYALLDQLAKIGEEFLTRQGIKATGFQARRGTGVDPQTSTTELPHKTAATRAGLGWIGRCALLVTETYGSAVRLTSILTDAPLPCGEPINDSRCGDCVECVRACPGQAANGEKWQAGKPRDEFFDAKICQATARNLAKDRTGIEDTFCGICMAACPWTKRYIQRATNSPSVDLDTNI